MAYEQIIVSRADVEELRTALDGGGPWEDAARRLVRTVDARCGWCGNKPRGMRACPSCGRRASDEVKEST